MTREDVKKAISNPILILYFVQGHINWLLFGWVIRKWYRKTKQCTECFNKGFCVECGCPFNQKALSNKPCKNAGSRTK